MQSHFLAPDAYKLLADELAAYRGLPYDDLVVLIGQSPLRRVRAGDSTEYVIQTTIRWRNGEHGDILVIGWVAVDDCGPMRRVDDQFVVPVPGDPKSH